MTDTPQRRNIDVLAILLALAGLATAIIGQGQRAPGPDQVAQVTPWWLISAAFFAALILHRERPAWLVRLIGPGGASRAPFIWGAVVCAVAVVALIVRAETIGDEQYLKVFLVWALGVALIILAVARRPRVSLRQFVDDQRADVLALIAFTVLAAVLRLVVLGLRPSVIGGDEGLFGTASRSIYESAYPNPFGTFHGAGTLYVHMIALLTSIFGVNAFGLRLVSAIAGTLAVPAVYLLGRELAGRRAGGIAALYLTVSHYHVHFSRMVAVTYLQGTFYNTLALYLLISGLRRDSRGRLMLAGLVAAIYFMIYLDARLFLAVIVAVIIGLALIDRAAILRNARRLLLMGIVFAIVAAPMLLWAARHPNDFSARFAEAGTFESGLLEIRMADTGESAVQLIAETALQTFMTLIAVPVFDFYFGDLPVLNVVSSILFLFGLVYALLHLRQRWALVPNIWLWSGIAAIAVFTLDPFAAGYRLLFVLPAVCILIGLGADRLLALLRLPGRATIVAIGTLAVAMTATNLDAYFLDYLGSCRFGGDEVTRVQSRLGQYLGSVDHGAHAYLLTDGSVVAGTHPSLEFLSRRMAVTNVAEPLAEAPPFDTSTPTVFVAVLTRAGDLATIAQQYPGGEMDRVSDCGHEIFEAYRLDPLAAN